MTMETATALRGFLVTAPVESLEANRYRIDFTIGQARWATQPDGRVIRVEPETCHVMMRGVAAERAAGAFQIGDMLIASGRFTTEETLVADDQGRSLIEEHPVFVADRLGPDCAEMSYSLLFTRRVYPTPTLQQPTGPSGPTRPSQPAGFSAPACAGGHGGPAL